MSELPALRPSSTIDDSVPHSARIWNYWMGGKDHYAVDRAAADVVAEVYPDIAVMARESRGFLMRVVEYLAAEAGVRQFIDIGIGLPAAPNTHEVAQRVAPESRIVYANPDELVLLHARALLVNTTPQGATKYINASCHDAEQIMAGAAGTLNLDEPIAVMFMGVLGYRESVERVRSIVARTLEPLASGSHLVIWNGTATSDAAAEGTKRLAAAGAVPYHLRTPEELASCFEGLELVEPGLVPITEWRPDAIRVVPIDAYGAVARKP